MATESTPLQSEKPDKSLCLVRTSACVLALAEGYDIGGISGVAVILKNKWNLETWQMSWLVGVAYFSIAFGAIFNGWLSDRHGRRPAMAFAYVLLIVGAVMMAIADAYVTLFLARFIQALGVGAGLGVVTTYMAEVAPAEDRGKYPSLADVFLVAGVCLGYASDEAFLGYKDSWRCILGFGAVLPTVCFGFLALGFVPESPRFLHLQGNHKEAEITLRKLVSEEETIETLRKWETQTGDSVSFYEVVFPKHPHQRRAFSTSLGVMICKVLSNLEAITVYLALLLSEEMDMEEAFGITLGLGVMRCLCAALASFYLIDRVGRRLPLMISTAGVAVSYAILTCAYSGQFTNSMIMKLGGFTSFCVFYSVGLGPVPYVYMSEAIDTPLRSKSTAIIMMLTRVYLGILLTIYPMLLQLMGFGQITLILFAINMCSFLFVAMYVPETKGTSLEDMHRVFS